MSHVVSWFLNFSTESSKDRFLSWFGILNKALSNSSISDDELVQFFKLPAGADLVKARSNFEGIIKNYYLLGFEPQILMISQNCYLFVLKYNFLFSVNLGIKLVLKYFNFRNIRREVEFKRVKRADCFNLIFK